jgi:glycosyltransferase involved in cell wall biosynthesis
MPSSPHPPLNSRPILFTEIVGMGGAERSILALARWLYEHGLPVHIVAYTDTLDLAGSATHPLSVVQLRPSMDPVHKVLTLRQHFASRPGAPKPLTSGYQPALHATLAGLRGFSCLMHDTPSLLSGARNPKTLRQRIGRTVSDRIVAHGLQSGGRTIVTSDFLRDDTRRIFCVDADIVRMGGLAQLGPPRSRPVSTSLRMLSVSRLEPNKRIDWIIRAVAALEHQHPSLSTEVDWRLDITGKGSQLESLRTLAHDLGVANRIHFLGYVDDAELDRLYDLTHLFLMPAVQGYGIPAIESLGRGIHVLLHRESGVSDILRNTPWATVLEGGEASMLPALKHAIAGVREGRHLQTPLPPIPTEDTWAQQVATICNWL